MKILQILKSNLKAYQAWFAKGTNRVKLIFLALSTLLWFMIKLSQGGYISEASFKLDFINLPQDQVLLEQPQEQLQLRLQGPGYALLKYNWFNFSSLEIDLKTLRKDSQGRAYWLSEEAKAYLQQQIGNEELEVLQVSPDTLFLNTARLERRSLPVKLNLQIAFDTNAYCLYQAPVIKPQEVWISAPAQFFQENKFLETEELIWSEAEDSVDFELALNVQQSPHLKVEQEKVRVHLSASPLTERSLKLEVQPSGFPDSLRVEFFPAEAEIIYQVALRDYQEVKLSEPALFAPAPPLNVLADQRFLSLELEGLSPKIRAYKISPKRVEFILSEQ